MNKKNFLSFPQVRDFARSQNIKNQNEWAEYCKSGKKPKNIPSSPRYQYKNNGWKGWGDFLGTKRIANQQRKFRSFSDAKSFAKTLGFKNKDEWKLAAKSGKISSNIPHDPQKTYKNKGWKGWGDWLGTGNLRNADIEFRPFLQARKYARSLELKSWEEWQNHCKSGKLPQDIPSNTYRAYNNKGWISAGDWLGTGKIADRLKLYRSFPEAKAFIRSLGIKNHREWKQYIKSGKKPDDIPAAPWKTYSKKNILRTRKLNEKEI